jgi:hypothetical protein
MDRQQFPWAFNKRYATPIPSKRLMKTVIKQGARISVDVMRNYKARGKVAKPAIAFTAQSR